MSEQIGFWRNDVDEDSTLPHPGEHIRRFPANLGPRVAFVKLLKLHGSIDVEKERHRSRLRCTFCGYVEVNLEYDDGTYRWNEMYVHYIEKHGVVPSDAFIVHVINRCCDGNTRRGSWIGEGS